MVQSIRGQQLEVVYLLYEIAQQQRDSDLALKSFLSELQLLKSKAMPQQSQEICENCDPLPRPSALRAGKQVLAHHMAILIH